MRVKFVTNLGSVDAGKLGLKFAACTEGAECDVGREIGEQLCSRGLATEILQPIKAVPPAPSIKSDFKKKES